MFKVGYHKRFSKDGTVYKQSVRISSLMLLTLREKRQEEINANYPRRKEYDPQGLGVRNFHISSEPEDLLSKNGQVYCYMTLTQTRFANLFLKLNLKDRNTYLIIEK